MGSTAYKTDIGWIGHRAIPWLTAVIGAVITLAIWMLVLSNERQKAEVLFEQQASPMITVVERTIIADLEVVHSIGNFYRGSSHVSREEFRVFVEDSLERYPNIQALEWIPRVPHAQRAEYEAVARSDGLERFEIREKRNEKMVAAAVRDEYFPVYYVEPLEPNLKAVGFDLASNPAREEALNQARDSGQPVATARITLVQESGSQAGFLLFAPIYQNENPNDTVEQRRRNLVGFALGVYRVDDLIEKVLEKEFYTDRGIHLLLYDRSAQKEGQLLYAHDNGSGGGHDDAPSLEGALKMPHLSHQFDVGGRQWVLMARPNVEFETYTNPLPLLALFLGLLITTMLLFSLRSITRRTRTIAQKVEEQTARLQRSEAYNQAVHDTVVDGIITINPQGVIQSCNPATGQMFGYDSGELPGRKINTLMPDHYAKAHDGYLHHYMETGEEHVIGTGREVEGQRSDGSVFPMDLAVSRMEIDGEAFFTGVVRDITERKRVDKMKAEFISTVSHELRTPLTSIHGAMGLVAGGAAGELSEQAMKLVTIAVNNSDRLVRLINDILDVEKIEAGKMQFNNKHMPLGPIVEQAVEENRAYAEEHGSSYQLQISGDDPVVDVDADRIRQVLDNLLSNAAKYGAEEDKIDVTVVVTGQLVQVTVQDHGPGIPEEFQNRIFSKFAQADSSDTRQKGGTGLGLSIAKAIVEQHGGQLWFETEKGEGTRFIIQLPVAKAFEEMAVNISESSCVLLCEDDPDVGKLLQLMLEKEGVASDLASSAEEALVMLRQKDYQAMTLDLMLPGRDGVSLLNELRETEQFKDLPVVVVTAKSKSEGDAFGVMQVSDWLTKPIEEQRLKHAVMLAIRSREEGGKAQVLHVEDDPDIITVVSTMLDECAVIEFASGLSEAQQLLDKKHYDLVILDISLPDGSGLDLLPRLSQFTPAIPVVIFSALEVDSNTAAKVAGVLVKSRGDSGRLAVMVKELIKTPTNINEAKRN